MANYLRNPFFSHKPPPLRNPTKPTTQIPSRNQASPVVISATHFPNPLQQPLSTLKTAPFLPLTSLIAAFPASSAEIENTNVPDKINLEAIVLAIDDFNNRNPFFVAGLAFIWLVVVPLAQQYAKKYKYVSAIDSFRRLRDDPNSQCLDIRKEQSLKVLGSPNLRILNKDVVHVEFSGVGEEEFVKEVMGRFPDPANTVLYIFDNFDGDSLVVAELLYKNGFKEAYAIKGGIRGKDGWQEIQEELLPPSTHVYPRKKTSKASQSIDSSGIEMSKSNSPNGQPQASTSLQQERTG